MAALKVGKGLAMEYRLKLKIGGCFFCLDCLHAFSTEYSIKRLDCLETPGSSEMLLGCFGN